MALLVSGSGFLMVVDDAAVSLRSTITILKTACQSYKQNLKGNAATHQEKRRLVCTPGDILLKINK